MDKQDSLRKSYNKKYLDESPQVMNSLVAPQTSGSRILNILKFEKKGDIYPAFKDKNVTDIGGGFSSLVFELSPSVKKITVMDPIFAYDKKTHIAKEMEKAEKRIRLFQALASDVSEDVLTKRKENQKGQQEVLDGITKWRDLDIAKNPKIVLNDSLAQHILGISPGSQDMVFLNFVLDKLQGDDLEDEILSAVNNAYRITASGGKIYGIHNADSKEDDIINALDRAEYQRDAYRDMGYMIFTIDKK